MRIPKLQQKVDSIFWNSMSMKIGMDEYCRNIHKILVLRAKIAYTQGEFNSLTEARRSVPSISRIKQCFEAWESMGNNGCDLISWTSEQINAYVA